MFNKTKPARGTENGKRKPYCKPKLEMLGDLRSITLGGSVGAGESGGLVRKVATGIPLPGDYPLDDTGASDNY